mgnify:CR=1 FL=1
MTGADHHRDDLDDRVWARLEPRLPGRVGEWGGIAEDNRRFVNAVLWILRTGSPWRDLPPDFGGWKNTHRRFCRWRDRGVWEQLLEVLIDEPDFEWLMVGTDPAGHRDDGGTMGGGEGLAKGAAAARRLSAPRYAWPWLRLVCRSDSRHASCPRGSWTCGQAEQVLSCSRLKVARPPRVPTLPARTMWVTRSRHRHEVSGFLAQISVQPKGQISLEQLRDLLNFRWK